MKALLIGAQPPLPYDYVTQPPYDGVVIGSLTLGQLLRFRDLCHTSSSSPDAP